MLIIYIGQIDNTIEKHLFDALIKLKLIENRSSCKYTRCGRTDKGHHRFTIIIMIISS